MFYDTSTMRSFYERVLPASAVLQKNCAKKSSGMNTRIPSATIWEEDSSWNVSRDEDIAQLVSFTLMVIPFFFSLLSLLFASSRKPIVRLEVACQLGIACRGVLICAT